MRQLRLVGENEEPVAEGPDPVQAVFDFWKALMDKPHSQLGPKRADRIKAAMKMGYTVDNLRLAIVGCKYDEWSQGQNDRKRAFNDIELICRDETKIDQFIELGHEYMRKTEAREKKRLEEAQPGVPMPAGVRERLDALFNRHRERK